jgi:hypothetical protein
MDMRKTTAASGFLLFALISLPAFGQNLVQNGGFETGNLTDWTLTPPFASGDVDVNFGTGYVHSGTYAVQFIDSGPPYDTLSQTLTTQAGTDYDLTFWIQVQGVKTSQADFYVSWDGTKIGDYPATATLFLYNEYQIVVTGTGSDTLSFSAYDNPGAYGLDDVSVTPLGVSAPEGGSALLDLLLAAGACGGAMLLAGRRKSAASATV